MFSKMKSDAQNEKANDLFIKITREEFGAALSKLVDERVFQGRSSRLNDSISDIAIAVQGNTMIPANKLSAQVTAGWYAANQKNTNQNDLTAAEAWTFIYNQAGKLGNSIYKAQHRQNLQAAFAKDKYPLAIQYALNDMFSDQEGPADKYSDLNTIVDLAKEEKLEASTKLGEISDQFAGAFTTNAELTVNQNFIKWFDNLPLKQAMPADKYSLFRVNDNTVAINNGPATLGVQIQRVVNGPTVKFIFLNNVTADNKFGTKENKMRHDFLKETHSTLDTIMKMTQRQGLDLSEEKLIQGKDGKQQGHNNQAILKLLPPAPVSEKKAIVESQDEKDFVGKCSKHTREYVEKTRRAAPSLSERIKALKLTEGEEKLFEKFIDPIHETYMNIPVLLNEKYYNFSTVATLKKDPETNETFEPLEVQSGRALMNELDAVIKQLESMRLAAAKPVAAPAGDQEQYVFAPGGPGAGVPGSVKY